MAIECDFSIFAAIGPFEDELLGRDGYANAVERLSRLTPIEAVQLVLATYCRSDSVIDRRDLDNFAE